MRPRRLCDAPRTAANVPAGVRARHPSRPRRPYLEGAALYGQVLLGQWMNLGHLLFTALFNVVYGQRLRDPFTMFKVFRRECLSGLPLRGATSSTSTGSSRQARARWGTIRSKFRSTTSRDRSRKGRRSRSSATRPGFARASMQILSAERRRPGKRLHVGRAGCGPPDERGSKPEPRYGCPRSSHFPTADPVLHHAVGHRHVARLGQITKERRVMCSKHDVRTLLLPVPRGCPEVVVRAADQHFRPSRRRTSVRHEASSHEIRWTREDAIRRSCAADDVHGGAVRGDRLTGAGECGGGTTARSE